MKTGIYKNIVVIIALVGLGGCATVFNDQERSDLVRLENNGDSALLQNKAVTRSILLAHFKKWKGTKYVYGGSGRNGIDCSGFIYQAFLSEFGIQLPRESIVQGEVGYDIPVELLQPGDLDNQGRCQDVKILNSSTIALRQELFETIVSCPVGGLKLNGVSS